MKEENLPKKALIWLLFDLDNGHAESRHYVWWFDTRRQARDFKKHHKTIRNHTELFGPVPYINYRTLWRIPLDL